MIEDEEISDGEVREKEQKRRPIDVGDWVLVRTKSAGVHFGILVEREGGNTVLSRARRIWSWSGAFTLSAIAVHGVGSGSKVSGEVEFIELLETIERILSSARVAEVISRHENIIK